MNEIIKYLYSLGVKTIKIESIGGETVLYFELYGMGFSPIIDSKLTLDKFKELLIDMYKKGLERQLEYAELEVETLKKKLLKAL